MPSNHLTWGLGSFQTCTIAPFVEAADNPSSSDSAIFSNGKLLIFGFKISPSAPTFPAKLFYEEFKNNFNHLIMSYQLVHEKKGILFSRSVSSKTSQSCQKGTQKSQKGHNGLQNDQNGCDQLRIHHVNNVLFISVSSRFKVSPMHLHKSLTLVMSLEYVTRSSVMQSYQVSNAYEVMPVVYSRIGLINVLILERKN